MSLNSITDEERRRYVEMYRTSSLTLAEIGQMAGVKKQSVWAWVQRFAIKLEDERCKDVNKPRTQPKPTADPRDAEIARLKAALEKAELRAEALDTMISVAEQSLNIKIRKKAGAKQ